MPVRTIELHHGDRVISTDRARVDLEAVHRWLSDEAYWAAGRTVETQRRAIDNSALVVGAYDPAGDQLGFARMVTDRATFAWLADVYVVAAARGTGLGGAMVGTNVEHPAVVSVRRQLLATRDAPGLSARFGYEPLSSRTAG